MLQTRTKDQFSSGSKTWYGFLITVGKTGIKGRFPTGIKVQVCGSARNAMLLGHLGGVFGSCSGNTNINGIR